MKVLLINATPMDKAYELWNRGLYPGHHLWGIIELQKNPSIECVILKHEKYIFLNKLGQFLNIQFLDQQLRTLWILKKCDVIYAPYAAANTKLLVLLKLFKLVKKPLIVVIHQPLFGGLKSENTLKKYVLKKLTLKFDSLIFLSNKLKNDLIENIAVSKEIVEQKFFHLDWGPDTNFYKKYLSPKDPVDTTFAISAGHTDRDFDTLIEAFRNINFPLKIFCTPGSLPKTKDIPQNVTIISNANHTSYPDLLEEYNNARFVLIPLTNNPPGTQGLTSILDVLAMGKPVIMTKNSNVDLDIDKEGIGISVDQGNVYDMAQAINKILNNYTLLKSMGERSTNLMYKRFNMSLFSSGLEKIFFKAYQA